MCVRKYKFKINFKYALDQGYSTDRKKLLSMSINYIVWTCFCIKFIKLAITFEITYKQLIQRTIRFRFTNGSTLQIVINYVITEENQNRHRQRRLIQK